MATRQLFWHSFELLASCFFLTHKRYIWLVSYVFQILLVVCNCLRLFHLLFVSYATREREGKRKWKDKHNFKFRLVLDWNRKSWQQIERKMNTVEGDSSHAQVMGVWTIKTPRKMWRFFSIFIYISFIFPLLFPVHKVWRIIKRRVDRLNIPEIFVGLIWWITPVTWSSYHPQYSKITFPIFLGGVWKDDDDAACQHFRLPYRSFLF
jgi:hypothetical protein